MPRAFALLALLGLCGGVVELAEACTLPVVAEARFVSVDLLLVRHGSEERLIPTAGIRGKAPAPLLNLLMASWSSRLTALTPVLLWPRTRMLLRSWLLLSLS